MPNVPATARRIREACDLAGAALADLQDIDSPTLWTGPAARCFGAELDEQRPFVRAALGAARMAADALESSGG